MGKVLLADLPEAELRALLGAQPLERFTSKTLTEVEALVAELAEVRRRGHAFDNEEYTLGVRCVAVPVRDHTGQVVAGMSVSVPTIRFQAAQVEQAVALLTPCRGRRLRRPGLVRVPRSSELRIRHRRICASDS